MANVFIDENILRGWADTVREKTGTTDKMLPAALLQQTQANWGTGGGGGAVGDATVKYVTFLNEDGTTLYQMPVLVGDDCKDPVTHGDIDAPEKEATNTIDYTHSGWTSTVGGTADADILKNITADKTVYAAFTASVRYYTVNFYDDDGTTLLKTVEATYGQDLSDYVPEKKNYTFVEWNPSVSNITSEFDTVAVWEDYVKTEWDYLAESVAAGTYKTDYSLGDTFPLTYNSGGTQVTVNMRLVAFDHDDKADGSGKAAMTFLSVETINLGALGSSHTARWDNSPMRTNCGNLLANLPLNVRERIKTVTKLSNTAGATALISTDDDIWVPSATELGLSGTFILAGQGTAFASVGSLIKYKIDYTDMAQPWQTRSGTKTNYINNVAVSMQGKATSEGWANAGTWYAAFGFCF